MPRQFRVANISAAFTGAGFAAKRGRCPAPEDCGFTPGPLDILCDRDTGLIEEIRPSEKGADPGGPDALDARGCIATAGFVDSHTHALHAGSGAGELFRRWAKGNGPAGDAAHGDIWRIVSQTRSSSPLTLIHDLTHHLDHMAECGTTVVEIKSGYGGDPYGELLLLHVLKPIRFQSSGPEVKATFLGLHALPDGVAGNEHCTAMIGVLPRLMEEGLADFADVFLDGDAFAFDEAMRFLRAAQDHGLRIKAHLGRPPPGGSARAIVRYRPLCVDHLESIDEEDVATLASSRTVATLLPGTSFFLGHRYADARRLIDAGVRVALATDFNPGTSPSYDMQFIALLAASQLRMTAAEILCAVTCNGAAALGMEASHGTLEAGRAANVLLWKPSGPHCKGIEHLEEIFVHRRRPAGVVIRGQRWRPFGRPPA